MRPLSLGIPKHKRDIQSKPQRCNPETKTRIEIPNIETSDPKQSTFKMTNKQTKNSICGNLRYQIQRWATLNKVRSRWQTSKQKTQYVGTHFMLKSMCFMVGGITQTITKFIFEWMRREDDKENKAIIYLSNKWKPETTG